MKKECEVCGNQYDKPIRITMMGIDSYFDSFQCAIQKLAPACARCAVKIIGHGVESENQIYCCANCAREAGQTGLKDRAEARAS